MEDKKWEIIVQRNDEIIYWEAKGPDEDWSSSPVKNEEIKTLIEKLENTIVFLRNKLKQGVFAKNEVDLL
jgi:hypothetical protein